MRTRGITDRLCLLLSLTAVLGLAGCASAPTSLPEGYAIVIVRGVAEPDSGIQQLIFESVEGSESFIVNVDRRAKLKILRPGHYYLANLRVSEFDGMLPGFDKPQDQNIAIEVREGAVNYIGDYEVLATDLGDGRISYDYRYSLNDRTKERALEIFPWITDYPLRATNPQGLSRPMRFGAQGPGISRESEESEL